MAGSTHVHDRALLDALERVAAAPFAGDVWRTTWAGRDALRGSSSEGRWSVPGIIEVLYTSLQRAASLAEVGYRLSLEPVWPSRAEHVVHKLAVKTERTLRLATFADLLPLGIDPALYPTLDYARTKAIAAAACFLEFRWAAGSERPTSEHELGSVRRSADGRQPEGHVLGAGRLDGVARWSRMTPR